MWFSGVTLEEARHVKYPDALYPIYWRGDAGKRWIKRGEILGYFDETWATAVELWRRWKMFGLPHGRGWLAETPAVLQAIDIVESEKNLYESRSLEEQREKSGSSRGTKSRSTR